MSNYTVTTDFTAKDALAPGHPSKVIKGTEFGTEFTNIATAVNSKADSVSPTFTGTVLLPATTSIGPVTNTEIGYLANVTSAIQTQLNAKAPTASPTFSGTITTPLTASRALTTNASSQLAASSVTSTELGYLSGVTSAIQTQLAAKYGNGSNVSFGTGAFSGAVTMSSTLAVTGAVTGASFQVTSSRELKQNIVPVAEGALERVARWGICEYQFKATPEKQEIGLIAEDSDPRVSNGKAIDLNAVVFELAAAVQELRLIVAAQEERITELEAR